MNMSVYQIIYVVMDRWVICDNFMLIDRLIKAKLQIIMSLLWNKYTKTLHFLANSINLKTWWGIKQMTHALTLNKKLINDMKIYSKNSIN